MKERLGKSACRKLLVWCCLMVAAFHDYFRKLLVFLTILTVSISFSAKAFVVDGVPSGKLVSPVGFSETSIDPSDRSAVVLIHGWNRTAVTNMFEHSEWPSLISALHNRLIGTDWKLLLYDWSHDASTGDRFAGGELNWTGFDNATDASTNAFLNGTRLANKIHSSFSSEYYLRRLVLIAHSAGSWTAYWAANLLLSRNPYLTINVVLLDPFIPGTRPGDLTGRNTALMSSLARHQHEDRIFRLENYFVVDITDSVFSPGDALNATSQRFSWSDYVKTSRHINGWKITDPYVQPWFFDLSINDWTHGHGIPIEYYRDTVIADTAGESTPSNLINSKDNNAGFKIGLIKGEEFLPKIKHISTDSSVISGNSLTLQVLANDAISYQWYKNGQPCGKGSNYSISSASLTDQGTYVVKVSNYHGDSFSDPIHISVVNVAPPTISNVTPSTLNAIALPQTQRITITGKGFTNNSLLTFRDGVNAPFINRVPIFVNSTQLQYDIAVGPSSATWTVTVSNAGVNSSPYTFYVRSDGSKPNAPSTPVASDGVSAARVNVSWAGVPGASSYNVFRCSSESISSCGQIGSVTSLTFSDEAGLSGTTYFYRVKACSSYGCSEYSALDSGFRGSSGVLPAPNPISASDGTYTKGVLVSWPTVSGADTYEVWRANSIGGTKKRLASGFRYTTYADTNAVYDRTYSYWVKSCNYSGACSSFSAADSGFIGQTGGTLSTPQQPDPANGDSAVSIKIGELAWQNGGGATSYDVYFGIDTTPDSSELLATTQGTKFSIPELDYSKTYYWRIDARANGQIVQGPVWQFTTRNQSAGELPSRAINPTPIHGAEDIPRSTTLRWSNGGGATSYDVYFGKNFEPSDAQYVGNTTTTSWSLSNLEYGQHYYWRIKARNSAGTAKGDIWHFETEPPLPKQVIWPFPSTGQTNVQTASFNLYWTDPAGTAKSYKVYFGTNPNPGANEFKEQTVLHNWQTPALQKNTTYYWQIVSVNNAGTTAGPVWSFSTWATSPGSLEVAAGGFASHGAIGGPFSVTGKGYKVRNTGEQALEFTVTNTHSWLQITPNAANLQPGQEVEVVATLTTAANALPSGTYIDSIRFNNTIGGQGTDQRAVQLVVADLPKIADIDSVSAGFDSVLLIMSDGTLHGWGGNEYGVLGLGSPQPLSVPALVPIDLRNNWAKVAVGWRHVLGLTMDGRLFAWGDNQYGQLGTGDLLTRTTPTQIGSDGDWSEIAVGSFSSFAIKKDGRLFAWGLNIDGYLGLGDYVNRSTPSQIGSDTNWKLLSSAYYRTVAIKSDGRMFTWGEKAGSDGKDKTVPVQVGSLSDWIAVSGGQSHFLALRSNGTLYSWGSNNTSGELGLGDLVKRYVPTQIGTDSDWKAIDAGGDHSLALKNDGRLFTWGDNGYGQLGLGDRTDRLVPTLAIQGQSISIAVATYGSSHVLLSDGNVLSWGRNDTAGLGLGHTWSGGIPHVLLPSKVNLNWPLPPTNVPLAPNDVTATAGDGLAIVTFIAPPSIGDGVPLTYTVSSIPSDGVDIHQSSSSTTHVISGLVNGRSYQFVATAMNIAGTSQTSLTSNIVIPCANADIGVIGALVPCSVATPPGKVTISRLMASNEKMTVYFLPPTSDGGSLITSYTASCSGSGVATRTANSTYSPITVTGLTNGVSYTCTVSATNSAGTGTASAGVTKVVKPASIAPILNILLD